MQTKVKMREESRQIKNWRRSLKSPWPHLFTPPSTTLSLTPYSIATCTLLGNFGDKTSCSFEKQPGELHQKIEKDMSFQTSVCKLSCSVTAAVTWQKRLANGRAARSKGTTVLCHLKYVKDFHLTYYSSREWWPQVFSELCWTPG